MPTTRRQSAAHKQERKQQDELPAETGGKRDVDAVGEVGERDGEEAPPAKKAKTKTEEGEGEHLPPRHTPQTGTIERGHIYFFYRPRVQLEEAHSIDDVRNFHILLVPRPPEFSSSGKGGADTEEEVDMQVLSSGADAVPAAAELDKPKKRFRLITVGKKKLPDPEHGPGRKETFWGTVSAVGDDLAALESGLGERTYETNTKGTRHEEPARLVARGGYAIVNNNAHVPSARETHLGYHVSHPPPAELGEVQAALGVFSASSFLLQVKNPLAPASGPQQARGKGAEYPGHIMRAVFGEGGERGREEYGLRFVSCETPELLDYEGAEVLLIAARSGEEGVEVSLGEGRSAGRAFLDISDEVLTSLVALRDAAEKDASGTAEKVFRELGFDAETFPAEPLQGKWI